MRLETDDRLRRIDSVWLGPDGYTFWWRWTYPRYLVALLVAVPVVLLERMLPIQSILTFAVLAAATIVALSAAIVRFSSFDEPARLLPVMVWHEAGAPREPKAFAVVVSVAKVRVAA